MRDRAARWGGGLVVLALAGCMAAGAVGRYRATHALRAHSEVVPGQVLTVHHGRSSWLTVRFTTAAGRHVQARLGRFRDGRRAGELIGVRYSPRNPGVAVDAAVRPDYFGAWLGGIGAVALCVLVPYIVGGGRGSRS